MAKEQIYIMDAAGIAQYRDVVRRVNQLPPPPTNPTHRAAYGGQDSAAPGGDCGTALCRVMGGDAVRGYTVDIFGNGPENPATGQGLLFCPELALNAVLPVNSRILGHLSQITLTGGSET